MNDEKKDFNFVEKNRKFKTTKNPIVHDLSQLTGIIRRFRKEYSLN